MRLARYSLPPVFSFTPATTPVPTAPGRGQRDRSRSPLWHSSGPHPAISSSGAQSVPAATTLPTSSTATAAVIVEQALLQRDGAGVSDGHAAIAAASAAAGAAVAHAFRRTGAAQDQHGGPVAHSSNTSASASSHDTFLRDAAGEFECSAPALETSETASPPDLSGG